MKAKAQASLEYLLLLAVLFSAFAALSPKVSEAFNAMLFASEVQKAKAFCEKLSATAEKASYFENSSSEKIKAIPELKWSLTASGSEILLEVESKALQKTKELKCETNAKIESFEQSFTKPFSLKVLKENGKILIVND